MDFSIIQSTSVIKNEILDGFCQCCLSENNLKNMLQSYNHDNKVEIYAEMINSCFSIEVINTDKNNDILHLICELCINKLRESYSFRKQIEEVQLKLQEKLYEAPVREDICLNEDDSPGYECPWDEEAGEDQNEGDNYLSKKEIKTTVKKKKKSLTKTKKLSKNVVAKTPTFAEAVKNFKETHKKYILDKNAVACGTCPSVFTTHSDLVKHMSVHFPNFVCDLCGKSFFLLRKLHSHRRNHTQDKIPCKICNQYLKSNSMQRHVQRHNGETAIYSCPHCPERFASFNLRTYHLADAHGVERKRYACALCPKTFSFSTHRSVHVRREHLQERKHACGTCGKEFFSRPSLLQHTATHTGERNFQCAVCLKHYTRKCTLNEHMKIHNNVKKHVCTVCDKSFTQKCTLKGHMKVHDKGYTKLPKDCVP